MNIILHQTIFALGASYLLALLFARLFSRWHIPKVSAYLLAGLVIGPSFAKIFGLPSIFNPHLLEQLGILSEIGLALIMVSIGSQFKSSSLRRWGKGLYQHSMIEIFLTAILVGMTTVLINFFFVRQVIPLQHGLLGTSLLLGLFLGIISMATAPAATLLVIREYESEGPITELVLALVGLNNLLTIIFYNIAAHFTFHPDAAIATLFFKLFIPPAIGIGVGLIASTWAQRMESKRDLQLLMFGSALVTMGLSRFFGLDIFLSSMALGVFIANASPKSIMVRSVSSASTFPLGHAHRRQNIVLQVWLDEHGR